MVVLLQNSIHVYYILCILPYDTGPTVCIVNMYYGRKQASKHHSKIGKGQDITYYIFFKMLHLKIWCVFDVGKYSNLLY